MQNKEYWLNKEKIFKEHRRRALAMAQISIEWLPREKFWNSLELDYKYPLSEQEYIDCELYLIRPRISIDPIYSPIEEDFPGPVERWYGHLSGHYFYFTFYYGNPGFGIIRASNRALKDIVKQVNRMLDVSL